MPTWRLSLPLHTMNLCVKKASAFTLPPVTTSHPSTSAQTDTVFVAFNPFGSFPSDWRPSSTFIPWHASRLTTPMIPSDHPLRAPFPTSHTTTSVPDYYAKSILNPLADPYQPSLVPSHAHQHSTSLQPLCFHIHITIIAPQSLHCILHTPLAFLQSLRSSLHCHTHPHRFCYHTHLSLLSLFVSLITSVACNFIA